MVKKIFCIFLFVVLPCVLFGAYDEYVRLGNSCYKTGKWLEAVKYYKQAYLEKPDAILQKYMNYAVQNAYKEGVSKGNAAYKSGNMEEALKWYSQAQSVSPNKQLESFIAKIKLQVGDDLSFQEPVTVLNNDSPWKWVLIGGDAALLGLTVALVLDYNNAADDYNAQHTIYDNTTDTLVQDKLGKTSDLVIELL